MKKGWPLVLLASVVFVTGCATQRVTYVKPGVTDAERRRDEAACIQ